MPRRTSSDDGRPFYCPTCDAPLRASLCWRDAAGKMKHAVMVMDGRLRCETHDVVERGETGQEDTQ